ncbi:AcuB3 [Desulfamplus magnetovallimortis]|uniref:AcuB3 n=1 Tax=Desulfamplus magnetovallimortis TaxID=1246637 RepID=A0A1W1HJ89_9BACT|nr:CBS and ACT domain-containing protein [Desulfamplus magnetovallimortis]SLM32524.1 AcuB3 [Desulfamplus magnetovallimortis]
MLINEWMSRGVITIKNSDSLNDAMRIFQKKMISMLPVLSRGSLVGIVTDGDIKKAMPSDATTLDKYEIRSLMDSVKIESVMSKPVITIGKNHTVDEAAVIMLSKGISGMPVVNGMDDIEGIITKSDVFRCLVSFTGAAHAGQIFAFRIKDMPGIIKTITDVIRMGGGRLSSILTSYDDVEDGFRKVFIHSFDIPEANFDNVVEQLRESAQMLYLADQTRNIRKLF